MNADATLDSVIFRLRNVVIRHPQFDLAYNAIVEVYEMNRRIGIAQNCLLVGGSGTGKSTVKNMIVKEYPSQLGVHHPQIPVLVIDTPSLPTVKNLAEELLIRFGDTRFSKGSAIDKTNRILEYIKVCGVKLLMIDEFQHFFDQGKRSTPREVSDWLKCLIERANVATVLMGLERSERILEVNEQLRRRFSRRIELRPFLWDENSDRAIFARVLKNLEDAAGSDVRMNLKDFELVRAFHFATNGIVDYMVKLLVGAHTIAHRKKLNDISSECLEQAFIEYIWHKGVNELNPFNKNFIGRRLEDQGMPFSK